MRPLRRLSRYLRPYAVRVLWAVGAMCAVAAFNGASVLLLKPIVDQVLIARDFQMLWLAVVALPLLIALKTVASYVQNYMMSWLGQRVTQDLREDLFRHLHSLPLRFFAQRESGDILSRVTGDLVVVQTALNSVPLYLIRDTMTLLALLASLFYLDWAFALLSLLALPLVMTVFWVLGRKMRASSFKSQAMMARLYQRFHESVTGLPVIRAFNYEEGVLAKFEEENDSFFAPMMSYLRATALSAPLLELCGAFIAALILYFGGSQVIQGNMTPGEFFAFLGAYFAAYAPAKNIARSNSELQRALASADRLFQLLDERPASALRRRALAPFPRLREGIRFESVTFRYPGRSEPVLDGASFELPAGRRTALLGRSGSGKSTVAQLLLGLHEPDAGRILFDGTDAREIEGPSLRAAVGLVSSDTLLFSDTIFENIALGRKVATLAEIERACDLAGAHEFIRRLPDGYGTRLGDGPSLSAGQRQRLGLARVILKDPQVVILDEATANLDPEARRETLARVETVFAGRTVLVIAHQLSALPPCDKTIVLSSGRAAPAASPEELLA